MGNGIQPTSTKYSNYSRKLANCGVQIISSLHFSESTDTLVADFNPHQFHPVSSSTGPTSCLRGGIHGPRNPKDEAKDEAAKWTMKVKDHQF